MLSLNRGRLRTDPPTGPTLVPLAALCETPVMHVLKEHPKETAKLKKKKKIHSLTEKKLDGSHSW